MELNYQRGKTTQHKVCQEEKGKSKVYKVKKKEPTMK